MFPEALLTGNFCAREMSDVTNAILEGASGFVLSESPNIDYLIEVMKMMNELCASVEPLSNDKTKFWKTLGQVRYYKMHRYIKIKILRKKNGVCRVARVY